MEDGKWKSPVGPLAARPTLYHLPFAIYHFFLPAIDPRQRGFERRVLAGEERLSGERDVLVRDDAAAFEPGAVAR